LVSRIFHTSHFVSFRFLFLASAFAVLGDPHDLAAGVVPVVAPDGELSARAGVVSANDKMQENAEEKM
jgi:hypothetical protein